LVESLDNNRLELIQLTQMERICFPLVSSSPKLEELCMLSSLTNLTDLSVVNYVSRFLIPSGIPKIHHTTEKKK
jgi:hypothetical protein